MERPSRKIDDIYTNGGLDIEQVITLGNNNVKRKVARRRWAILAKALKSPTGSEPSSPTDECSVRRISSFMLLTTHLVEHVDVRTDDVALLAAAKRRTWYKYMMRVEDGGGGGGEYHVLVGHRMRTFSAEDLMGFNNTGNVCIWPSEETLTYYLGANLRLVDGKSVLELGGGMSCLAGLVCAKYGGARRVHLTDGNKLSVENVVVSLVCNEFACPVSCAVLKWGQQQQQQQQQDDDGTRFDVVLCADCLFFDDARADLIVTLWARLADDGVALVMAPQRGKTLASFVAQCHARGFRCKQIVNYNRTVWEKHLLLLTNCDYDDNIHYPILIELTKA